MRYVVGSVFVLAGLVAWPLNASASETCAGCRKRTMGHHAELDGIPHIRDSCSEPCDVGAFEVQP